MAPLEILRNKIFCFHGTAKQKDGWTRLFTAAFIGCNRTIFVRCFIDYHPTGTYLKENQNTAARDMAFASLGFFMSLLYLAVGVFAFAGTTLHASACQLPIYLCYLMTFWYKSTVTLLAPLEAQFPVPLHAVHAATALFGLEIRIFGTVAKQSAPQQTVEISRMVQLMWNPQPMGRGFPQQ
ncbi:hypothetical protein BV898_13313 [Hypsibius exemplaris]|uniref:Uncharacterized protein n=1 Tax=Hypsibius exemplaris TaxID=2072580 RepID=A0A1W0WB92_HYPEX|nr:hypothetical protein BV898_13313 [Hypsibius exemplaris]